MEDFILNFDFSLIPWPIALVLLMLFGFSVFFIYIFIPKVEEVEFLQNKLLNKLNEIVDNSCDKNIKIQLDYIEKNLKEIDNSIILNRHRIDNIEKKIEEIKERLIIIATTINIKRNIKNDEDI